MKFYLSSFKLGNRQHELGDMIKGHKRVGVIRNALDFSTDTKRLQEELFLEFSALESIGLVPEEIDLRSYFENQGCLASVIEEMDALWVVGGNAFLLNYAFRRSGLSNIIVSKLGEEHFVYAGYSAGVCVLTPTLEGIHLVDNPVISAQGYPDELPWEGLGVVPFSIAPHWRSEHPESDLIEKSVEYFINHKMPFVALKDGDVYMDTIKKMPDNTCSRA